MRNKDVTWCCLAVVLLTVAGFTMAQLSSGANAQSTDSQKKDAASKADKEKDKDDVKPKADPQGKGVARFMRMKLDASGLILEGLAVEDYDLIKEGAERLAEMSAAEKWRVSNDALYREHSVDFQRIAKRLIQNAKDEKLEASALTWLEATMQCIECHKWARANMIASGKK